MPVTVGNRERSALGPAVPKEDEFVRILDGKGPQQDGIDERKNGGVGADAQG